MISRVLNWFRDSFFKKLVKNAAVLISGNIGASGLGFISMILSINVLGIETFGIFTIMQTIIGIFNKLLNFQCWEAIIKFGAEAVANKDDKALKSYIKQGFILDFSSAVLGTLTAFLFAGFIGRRYGWDDNYIFLLKIFTLVILFDLSGTPTGILRLYGKFKTFTYQKLTTSFLKLLGVLLVYYLKMDITIYVIVVIVTEITGFLILTIIGYRTFILRNKYREKVGFINGHKFLKFTFLTNINSTLSLPMKELDKVIASLISFEAVGIYKLIKQILNIIGKIVTPIYQTIYPELAKFISEKNFRKAVSVSKRLGLLVFLAGVPFLIILAPTSRIWLQWITDIDSVHYSIIVSLFLLQKVIANLFICVNSLFISAGYIKNNFFISLTGSLLYALTAYFITINYGLIGILIASFIQMFWANGIKVLILSRDDRLIKIEKTEYSS